MVSGHYQWIITITMCYWVIKPVAIYTTAKNCEGTETTYLCSALEQCWVRVWISNSGLRVTPLCTNSFVPASERPHFLFKPQLPPVPPETSAVSSWSHKYRSVVDKESWIYSFKHLFIHILKSFSSTSICPTQCWGYMENKYLSLIGKWNWVLI